MCAFTPGQTTANLMKLNLHYDASRFPTGSVTRRETDLFFKHAARIWLPCRLHFHTAPQSTLEGCITSQHHSAQAWRQHNKRWLPSLFPSASKYNRKIAIQCTHIISLRRFLGIPLIAFLCHYMGTQTVSFNSIVLAWNNSNFVFSIYIHTYMLWGGKEIHPNINSYTVMSHLTTEIRSEKGISRWFCRCVHITVCTNPNRDSIACPTPRLYGLAHCS